MKIKGLTLIELMIYVAIAGLLAAIMIGTLPDAGDTTVEDDLTTRIDAGLKEGSHRESTYWNAVIKDASSEYTPVCVHGIPGFVTRRGNQAGTLTLAMDPRGHKVNQKFWAACAQMGSDLHEDTER